MSTSKRFLVVAVLALAVALVVAVKRGTNPPTEAPSGSPAASGILPPVPSAAPGSHPAAAQAPLVERPARQDPGLPRHRTKGAAGALPRLLDIGADRCIPCKAMAPILEELRRDYAGRLRVDFIDAWKHPEEAAPYEVYGIPVQIFFDPSGRELHRHMGFISKEDILATWLRLGYSFTPNEG